MGNGFDDGDDSGAGRCELDSVEILEDVSYEGTISGLGFSPDSSLGDWGPGVKVESYRAERSLCRDCVRSSCGPWFGDLVLPGEKGCRVENDSPQALLESPGGWRACVGTTSAAAAIPAVPAAPAAPAALAASADLQSADSCRAAIGSCASPRVCVWSIRVTADKWAVPAGEV